MSETVIEPSAVYRPGESPAPSTESIKTGRQKTYDTYNTREVPLGGQNPPPTAAPAPASGGGGGSPGGRNYNVFVRFPPKRANTPAGMPQFLGNSSLILFAWIVSMIMVGLDEWHSYHILPRPARLWYTSLTYMILALVSMITPLMPITNLFAIGFAIVLGYQYYNGTGQFAGKSASKNNLPPPPPPPAPVPAPSQGANTVSSRVNPTPGVAVVNSQTGPAA